MKTQTVEFWQERIKRGDSVEQGMAIGFSWDVIDPIHDAYMTKHIKASDKVLDAGCGYGRRAGFFKDKKYVGIDLVPEFIQEARRRHPNKRFILGDLAHIPFGDKTFDWALLISVRKVIQSDSEEKWQEVLKELRRVAKQLLFLEYGNSIPSEIHSYVEVL